MIFLSRDSSLAYDDIVANSQYDPAINGNAELVLDARPKGRFVISVTVISLLKYIWPRYTGTDPEPRPGLSSGHIPHSHSLTFNLFLQKHKTKTGQEYSSFLPPSEIKAALDNAVGTAEADQIIQGKRPVVASCGSGMTAGVLWLGLQLLGVKQVGLYDEVRQEFLIVTPLS